MTPLTVELPGIFEPVAQAEGLRLLEHAALECRVDKALLAMALACEGEVAVIAPDIEPLRWTLADWIPEVRGRKAGRLTRYALPDLALWLLRSPQDLPDQVETVFVLDAHRMRGMPRRPKAGVYAGQIATRGHWFHAACREPGAKVFRLNALDIGSTFPDQLERIDPKARTYRRLMLLEDTEPRLLPLRQFARERLKIETQKGPEFLSDAQREEARRQLGEGWHTGRLGTPVVTFEVSRLQQRFLAQVRMGRRRGYRKFILVKYRRGGFSSIVQGGMYELAAERPNVTTATIADTRDRTQRIFAMASRFHDSDPDAPKLVGDSKTALEFANGSRMYIGTAGAKATFRGDAIRVAHGTEVAFWCPGPNQERDVMSLLAAISGATEGGEVFLESTPNGRNIFYRLYKDAKEGLNDYWPIFLRWFDDPCNVAREGSFDANEIETSLTAEEKTLVDLHHLAPAQVAFRRAKKKEYGRLFPQEMPEDDEKCFLASGSCYFDVEAVTALLDKLPAPKLRHVPGGYEVILEQPIPGEEYVGGVDCSEGLPGCDPNGAGILHRATGRQVAWVHGLFKPRVLAGHVVRLGKLFNSALMGIERENHGHAVIQAVEDLDPKGPYSRAHFNGGSLFYCGGKRGSPAGQRAGWTTSPETRPVMIVTLAEFVDAQHEGIADRDLLAECIDFVQVGPGKWAAASGAHDDRVIYWAIAYEMRKHRVIKGGGGFAEVDI